MYISYHSFVNVSRTYEEKEYKFIIYYNNIRFDLYFFHFYATIKHRYHILVKTKKEPFLWKGHGSIMNKRSLKGGAMLAPVPAVMVSVGDEQTKNILTVAWCGTLCTTPAKTYISVRPSRHSYEIIKRTGEFVINLTPVSLTKEADYCGTFTGAKVNKFEKCGFTPAAIEGVSAPAIAECPLSIACKVTDVISLGTHDMFIADVVSVAADEALFDEKGALHMEKADLCAYVHGAYFSLGKKIGNFGFSAVKKKKKGKTSHGKRKD